MDLESLRIGTRGSDLALAQSYYVQSRIEELTGTKPEIVVIKTAGDRIQNVPLSSLVGTSQERKGFFTKEIEDALFANEIDLAVHSYKDLPSIMPEGLVLASLPQRLLPLDVLIFPKIKKYGDTLVPLAPGSRVGTSSIRRISQMEMRWPDLKCLPLRGNVISRINKLFENKTELDAILLSGAGYQRLMEDGLLQEKLGKLLDKLEVILLPASEFVPAPAQGALAIQCRESDNDLRKLLLRIEDYDAKRCVRVERTLLVSLEGGCYLPLGSYCTENQNGIFDLHVFLGKESKDNRRKKSFYMFRQGTHPETLAVRAVKEMKQGLPCVVTGREDRIKEILNLYPQAYLYPLPLITIENLALNQDEESLHLRKEMEHWMRSCTAGDRIVLFSASGAEAFASFIQTYYISLPPFIRFSTVGERTHQALMRSLPQAVCDPPFDSITGDQLSKNLLSAGFRGSLLAVSAERGREEFYINMKEAGLSVSRFELYRSVPRHPEPPELIRLPDSAVFCFGSPSGVDSFFDTIEKHELASFVREKNWCFAALGPTTASAVRARGEVVYAQAALPDYELLLEELADL